MNKGGKPPKLTLEQRMAIRRRVREEREKGKGVGGGHVIAVMRALAEQYGVSYGCISNTVYGR
jgi:hypothetical protein